MNRSRAAAVFAASVLVILVPSTVAAATCPGGATIIPAADSVALETAIESAAGDLTICISGTYDLSGLTLDGSGHFLTFSPGVAATLTIVGTTSTASGTVLDGGSAGGVLIVFGADVVIDTVTLRNGDNGSVTGGVHVQGGSATITDSAFEANSGGVIGGLLADGVAITRSVFDGNSGGQVGGAAVNIGTVLITDSTFANNIGGLFPGTGGFGAGGSPSVAIAGSTFTGNVADSAGGLVLGAIMATGPVSITDSLIEGNTATSGVGGGAYLIPSSSVDIAGSVFDNNDAAGDGGGLAILGSGPGTIDVSDSTFSSNTSGTSGGALIVDGPLELSGSTFSGNSAVSSGGALEFEGMAAVENSTFVGNSAPIGEAVHSDAGSPIDLDINHVTMDTGQAIALDETSGGAGANFDTTSSVVDGCTFLGSVTVVSGGSNFDVGAGCGLGDPTDQSGSDPVLLGLADNGGPTATMLPGPGSPLIDMAAVGLGGDQRGVARPIGPSSDIGAVELDLDPITASDFSATDEEGLPLELDLTPHVTSGNTNIVGASVVSVTNGTATVDGLTVTFTAESDFRGTAMVDYTVFDNYGQVSNVATITIDVLPNLDPISAADFSAVENQGVPLLLILNPHVSSGNTTIVGSTVGAVSNGSAVASGLSITFTADDGFAGIATVQYTVFDNFGQVSNVATITIDVLSTIPATGISIDHLLPMAVILVLAGMTILGWRRSRFGRNGSQASKSP